jgi:N utilization substance protein A
MKGARVKNIVRELNNEKVDIIRWSSDIKELVHEALKPAKLRSVTLNEGKKSVEVRVDNDQLSLAIGKRGQNARLTQRLTGWEINIQEDTSAKEAMNAKVTGATAELMHAFGITEDVANALVKAGLNSLDVFAGVSAEDIVDAASVDPAVAAQIVAKLQENSPASQ